MKTISEYFETEKAIEAFEKFGTSLIEKEKKKENHQPYGKPIIFSGAKNRKSKDG